MITPNFFYKGICISRSTISEHWQGSPWVLLWGLSTLGMPTLGNIFELSWFLSDCPLGKITPKHLTNQACLPTRAMTDSAIFPPSLPPPNLKGIRGLVSNQAVHSFPCWLGTMCNVSLDTYGLSSCCREKAEQQLLLFEVSGCLFYLHLCKGSVQLYQGLMRRPAPGGQELDLFTSVSQHVTWCST